MRRYLLSFLFLAVALCCSATLNVKPVLSVLGDSYSTFAGYIPAGNEPWYSTTAPEKQTDVRSVRQTWWWQLISEGGFKLGVNESYSGSTISYTGYRGEDYRERSFITRLPRVGCPDILLIFGGTNDSWCGAPIGEYKYDGLTVGHYYEFRPALGHLLSEAQCRLPGTRIIFIINSDLTPVITESIITECKHFGVEYIELKGIDKKSGHPSVKGMEQIKTQIMEYLKISGK